MRKFIAIITALILSSVLFAQHVLYLNSGEKLTGEVSGGKKDTLFFSFYGNNLKIAHDNITAIYFSSEEQAPAKPLATSAPVAPIPPAVVAAPIPAADPTNTAAPTNNTTATQNQANGSIRGVITYYLTKQNVTKPDVGARVTIIDSASVPDFNLAVVDTFHFGNSYREIYNQYKLNHAKVPRDIPEQMMIWKSDTKTTFDLLTRRAYKEINTLKKAENQIKSSTDEKGLFNVTIKPGTYYIYIISSYATGETIMDLDGKVYCKKIHVKSGDESFIRNSFDVF